jgi:hypothetical protein
MTVRRAGSDQRVQGSTHKSRVCNDAESRLNRYHWRLAENTLMLWSLWQFQRLADSTVEWPILTAADWMSEYMRSAFDSLTGHGALASVN